MQEREKEAMGAICLMAAMADGGKSDIEQTKMKEIAQSLGIETSVAVVQRVLLRKTTLDDEVAALTTPDLRMLAFEMAVCICDADGMTSSQEGEFLNALRDALSVPVAAAQEVQMQAEEFAKVVSGNPVTAPEAAAPAPTVLAEAETTLTKTDPLPIETVSETLPDTVRIEAPPMQNEAEINKTILNHAILVGGLELLPQSLSTIAILPLQMKLVYNIGSKYGYQLDRGHIKEFLAVLGVGMTSQFVEGFARKFLGSLTKRIAGHMAGDISSAATGAAVTFASTYGIGMVAKKYYASGRQISMADMKTLFAQNSEEAKSLYSQYAGQITQSAKSTNVSSLLSMVRGK